MTNREKFGEKILDIMSIGDKVAIDKKTNEPVKCDGFSCYHCLLHEDCTPEHLASWLNAKHTEPQIDWSKVAVDTPILARNYASDNWEKRHFAKYEDGVVYTWYSGGTSWSTKYMSTFEYVKLAEVNGNE